MEADVACSGRGVCVGHGIVEALDGWPAASKTTAQIGRAICICYRGSIGCDTLASSAWAAAVPVLQPFADGDGIIIADILTGANRSFPLRERDLRKIRVVNAHGGGEGNELASDPDAAQIAPSTDFRLARNMVAAQAHKQQRGKANRYFLHGNKCFNILKGCQGTER
jgi:hypothetical protein